MNLHRSKGITLIELMVVVLIISILASIAYPSYRQYTIRANRTEAKTELLQRSQGLEKCYTRYNSYDHDDCTAVDDLPLATASGNYTISVRGAIAADAYTLQAVPQGGQIADNGTCGTLAINNMGRRFENVDQPATPATRCW